MYDKKRDFSFVSLLGVLALATTAIGPAWAIDTEWNTGASSWTTAGNWSAGFIPEAAEEEVAVINNGGVATLNTNTLDAAGLILGRLEEESGTLRVLSGGSLALVDSTGAPTGAANIGLAGAGLLEVQGGGSFSTTLLDINTSGNVIIGGGSGNASVASTGSVFNGGTITTHGGGHVFTAAGDVTLEGGSSYIANLTSATHTTLSATGAVNLGGNLVVQTTGFTPTSGNSWNLFDAGSITGQFSVDTSAAPALPLGQAYRFSLVPNASNGVYGQLSIDQLLVLNVDRSTGAASISNGPSPISIDGYSVKSQIGAINPGSWNSLQDQGNSNWRESPQGGSANIVSELKPTGSLAITDASAINLGAIFQTPTPTEFGVEMEDLTFEYYSAGSVVSQGVVNYTGEKQYNNLVLEVDPLTGEARFENESPLSVAIEGYKIESASGSLLFADGQWSSLDDQDAAGGDWRESNPSANLLSELKPLSSTTMSGGGFGFDLGTLFNTVGGSEDLTLQYLLTGEDEFRDGVVAYREIVVGPDADFNDDTLVDGTDLGIWETAYGSNAGGDADGDNDSDGSDFLAWQRQFTGGSGISAVAAVPEPSTLMLLMGAICPLALAARRK